MLKAYPESPVPYTIEIELTNYCNARCIFCSNSVSNREKGFIDTEKLVHYLEEQKELMPQNWFNKKIGKNIFPKIVLAGLGEPLLHKDIFKIIKKCKEHGFRVQLVTNGMLLTEVTVLELIKSGIDEIAISLHSLNREIYNSITELDLAIVLPRVEQALHQLRGKNIKVELWRIKPPANMKREDESDEKKYNNFVSKYDYVTVLGPSEPWERDGIVDSLCDGVNDDPDGQIWCHKIFFTQNIAWNGDIVLCCNDYNRISVKLGNVFENINLDLIGPKKLILSKKHIPEICHKCRRWKDVEYDQIVKEQKIEL